MADEREPFGLALIVCDGIHTDPGTAKKTLLGLFSTAVGPQFPLVLSQMCIYAAMTECFGKTAVEVRIVDVSEERDPLVAQGEIDCADPLTVVDMAFFFRDVTFPTAGEYRVQLYAGGMPIMERRLMAVQAQPHSIEGGD